MRGTRLLTFIAYVPFLFHLTCSQAPPQCVNETLVRDNINNSNHSNNQFLPYVRARFPRVHFFLPTGNPYTGHQNFSFRCIQAVDHYLENQCRNDSMVRVDERLLTGDEFPCGAKWTGDTSGAPEVRVSYAWATEHCPGWQMSRGSDVYGWTLVVGFVLPALIYSFNVPRPRKLRLWEALSLPRNVGNERLLAGLFGAVGADVCVVVDAIVWVMTTFAFAGPFILSGLYEAQLDKRVLTYVKDFNDHADLKLGLKARMLFSVLCGNLDTYPAWSDTMDLASYLDKVDSDLSRSEIAETRQHVPQATTTSTPSDMNQSSNVEDSEHSRAPGNGANQEADLLPESRSQGTHQSQHLEAIASGPANSGVTEPQEPNSNPGTDDHTDSSFAMEAIYDHFKTIAKVTVRLRAMLACQYSYGTTLGGPIVFFLGSFLYTLLQLKEYVGDEGIAEALAFGMWWMIVPHVGIVSSLQLAGHNPAVLEGIVGIRDYRYVVADRFTREQRHTVVSLSRLEMRRQSHVKRILPNLMEQVYESEYQPVWMFSRGRHKHQWLMILFADSWEKYRVDERTETATHQRLVRFLNQAVMLSVNDWIFLWLFAFLLLFAPWLFGFLTAYWTPEVGIACRAFTFLLYMPAQTVLLILWTYYLTWRDEYWVLGRRINRQLQQPVSEHGEESELLLRVLKDLTDLAKRDTSTPSDPIPAKKFSSAVQVCFYGLCGLCAFLSLLASIGGTFFQAFGLFNTNLCLMTASHWLPSRSRASAWLLLSTNANEEIFQAQRHWIVIGIVSVVWLGVVCYVGWYYQKVLRAMFKRAAGQLDEYPARRQSCEMLRSNSHN